MYKLMRVYRDEYGQTRQRYITQRAYRNFDLIKRKADEQKGGYMVRLGSNAPEYVGPSHASRTICTTD